LHLAGADEEHGGKQRDEERLFCHAPTAGGTRSRKKNGVGEVVSAVSPPFSGTFRPFFTQTQRSVQTECLVDWKKLGVQSTRLAGNSVELLLVGHQMNIVLEKNH
jgi:hypothetical protein